MKIGFVSLGCSKNQLDTEVMLHELLSAGYEITPDETEADVVVINTCAFIESAKKEAIDNILDVAWLKKNRSLKAIIVTGCLAERYGEEILEELPEVDAVLGVGSIHNIVEAIEAVTTKKKKGSVQKYYSHEDKDTVRLGGDRVLTTPEYAAYIKIAEGCDNRCAYCAIPSIRGKFRSRPIEDLIKEAKQLEALGVKELTVVAQDITRYGIDLYGEKKLPALLRELCKMDFRWIRLHYLYPDEIDDELIDTIAEEPKILKYLDIPIQHCNDEVLRAMNRRNTKEELLELFYTLRGRIDGLVLRTSLITGLPFEDEDAFDELCRFLREVQIERAGVFPYSPEEGTRAALMENRVDTAEAERRAELVVDVQSRIMDDFNESRMGDVTEVLCEGWDAQSMSYVGRSWAESPDIDGRIYFTAEREVADGEFVPVRITGSMDGELTGELWEE
jgi:ribosomal protein S12 methylthiotransferase